MKIYLASKSPRRQALLQMIEVDFTVVPCDIEEHPGKDELPFEYSRRICREKLNHAYLEMLTQNRLPAPVLSADTEVVLNDVIFGKPRDYQDAFAMLSSLSNQTHDVITSVAVKYLEFEEMKTVITKVYFADIPPAEIHQYLEQNAYLDKAGAYGIQSSIAKFIDRIDGCYYAVMGLPLFQTHQLLSKVQQQYFMISDK